MHILAGKKYAIAAVLLLLVLAGAAFYEYGREGFRIRVQPAADIVFYSGERVLRREQGTELTTGLLRFGTYTVIVEKEGYGRVKKKLHARFGKGTRTVDVSLSPEYGSVKIASDPPGAKVVVRSRDLVKNDATPCEIGELFAFPASVEVSIPGALPFCRDIEITAGQTLDLGVISFKASLKVDSEPPGAEVLIDGQLMGKTPCAIADLLAKRVVVEVRGHGVWTGEVEMAPQATADLGVLKLRDFPGKWSGTWQGRPLLMFLKRGAGNRLYGAVQWEGGWTNYAGQFSGPECELHGAPNCWSAKPLSFKGRLVETGIRGQFVGPNGSEGEISLADTSGQGYVAVYNPDLRYFARSDNAAGDGYIVLNDSLIAHVPDGKSSGWVDITPFLGTGENRLSYEHYLNSGSEWRIDFAVKRVDAGGQETILCAGKTGAQTRETGMKFYKAIVLPYADEKNSLAEWKKRRGADCLEEATLYPLDIEASSQYSDRHPASQALDDDSTTAWMSGEGKTAGERLSQKFGRAITIHGICLFSGTAGSSFGESGSVKRATVEMEGRRCTIEAKYSPHGQYFALEPATTAFLRMTVDEVYPGKRHDAVAIGELRCIVLRAPTTAGIPADIAGIEKEFKVRADDTHWGKGVEVVKYRGNLYLNAGNCDTPPRLALTVPFGGDFCFSFDLAESGGVPRFDIGLAADAEEVTVSLARSDDTWQAWLPGNRAGSIPFRDTPIPVRFRIIRQGDLWRVRIGEAEVIAREIPVRENFSEVRLTVPRGGRFLYLGKMKLKAAQLQDKEGEQLRKFQSLSEDILKNFRIETAASCIKSLDQFQAEIQDQPIARDLLPRIEQVRSKIWHDVEKFGQQCWQSMKYKEGAMALLKIVAEYPNYPGSVDMPWYILWLVQQDLLWDTAAGRYQSAREKAADYQIAATYVSFEITGTITKFGAQVAAERDFREVLHRGILAMESGGKKYELSWERKGKPVKSAGQIAVPSSEELQASGAFTLAGKPVYLKELDWKSTESILRIGDPKYSPQQAGYGYALFLFSQGETERSGKEFERVKRSDEFEEKSRYH